jgi:hypothetical protein
MGHNGTRRRRHDDMEDASSKLDIAIEAGGRGDWPMAEPCIAEAKRTLSRILMAVERLNDIDRLSGRER